MSRSLFLVIFSMIVVLSGCSIPRFGDNNLNSESPYVIYSTKGIQEREVVFDSQMSDASTSLDSEEGNLDDLEQMVNFEIPSYAINLSPANIAGVWILSIGGSVCRVATPQTKSGQGYRAFPLSCPKIFSKVNSWAVSGKKLYFYDDSGKVVAAFYSANGSHFAGYTFDNQAVLLKR
ncbi:AprI/Inh family metalloprotease inhibitor [Bartonella ancashensis]|nr:AprI/Inh family metalloprotease inhibitor [Bartonella ancashensis]